MLTEEDKVLLAKPVSRVFYAATSSVSKALITQWQATQLSFNRAVEALLVLYKADDLIYEAFKPRGLAFFIKPPRSAAWRLEQHKLDNGTWFWRATPNGRTKKGKRLLADLETVTALGEEAPGFGVYCLRLLGMEGRQTLGMGATSKEPEPHYPLAGITPDGERVVLSLPTGGSEGLKRPPFWSLRGMKRVSQDQYLELVQ